MKELFIPAHALGLLSTKCQAYKTLFDRDPETRAYVRAELADGSLLDFASGADIVDYSVESATLTLRDAQDSANYTVKLSELEPNGEFGIR